MDRIPDTFKAVLTEDGDKPKRKLPIGGDPLGLSLDAQKALGAKLLTFYHETRAARRKREEYTKFGKDNTGHTENRITQYEREYLAAEAVVPKSWPICDAQGNARSADFRLPVLRSVIDAETAQLTQATFANKPEIMVDPGRTRDKRLASKVQTWFAYAYDSLLEYPERCAEMISRMGYEAVGLLHLPYRNFTEESPQRVEQDGDEASTEEAWEETFDGPACEVVRRDRLHLYPASAQWINGPNKAWALFYTYELTRQELLTGKRDGRYDVDETLWADFTAPKDGMDRSGIDPDEHAIMRRDALSWTAVDVYCGYDIEGDGIERACLFTLIVDTGDVVRQRRAILGGWRPFAQYYSRDAAGTFEGVSTAQLIDGCCVAINQFTNQLADTATLNHLIANTPILPRSAGIRPEDLYLGSAIITDDGSGVRTIPYIPNNDNAQAISFFWQMIEQLTGVSRNNMGVPNPSSKTATESSIVAGNNSLLFDQRIKRLDAGHRKAAQIVALQMYANGPAEIPFRRDLSGKELDRARRMASSKAAQAKLVYDAECATYDANMKARMDMLLSGDTQSPFPEPPEPVDAADVDTTTYDTLTPADFHKGLEYTPNGSTSQAGYQARMVELQQFMAAIIGPIANPFTSGDPRLAWKAWSVVFKSFKHLGVTDPEDILGPEPDVNEPAPGTQQGPQGIPPEALTLGPNVTGDMKADNRADLMANMPMGMGMPQGGPQMPIDGGQMGLGSPGGPIPGAPPVNVQMTPDGGLPVG